MTRLASRTLLQNVSRDEISVDPSELRYQRLKVTIHEHLVESLDLSLLAEVNQNDLTDQFQSVAQELCQEFALELHENDRERMLSDLMDEVYGLGPLEALMKDETITDVLVNHPHEVYIERFGRIEPTDTIFADEAHLVRIIQRVVARVGRRIDEVSPMVDARLPDGSRVNAVVRPLALDGPTLSIRKFGVEPLKIGDLVEFNTLTDEMVEFLAAAVDARVTFLISGGTGAGKTTLLNALTTFIPDEERLVTIEDSAELRLQHRHTVRLETRPPNTEGAGQITQRELVRNSLRMRPDRIIIGEVRGAEALDLLQAVNTGHEGSLTTIHANDTRDALARLEMMIAMSGFELPIPVVRQYISTGIRLVVQLARLKGGQRRVVRITEIIESQDGTYHTNDIFGFEQTGVDEDGISQGDFYTTGYRPACRKMIESAGIHLPDSLFQEKRVPLGS
jgi:pilus assembly protein CpaF